MKLTQILPMSRLKLISIAGISLVLAASAQAAIVTGSISFVEDDTLFDITTLGSEDWSYWTTSDNPASGTATNSKLDGTIISDLFNVGGTSVRGTGSGSTSADFTFTDGTSLESGTVTDLSGLFNSSLNNVGLGIGLEFTLPTTDIYTIAIWAAGYRVDEATLTASFEDGTKWENAELITGATTSPKDTYMYSITAQADTAGDILGIDLILTDSGGASANLTLTGAATSLAAVPEPSTTAVFILSSALGFAFIRRRRKTGAA